MTCRRKDSKAVLFRAQKALNTTLAIAITMAVSFAAGDSFELRQRKLMEVLVAPRMLTRPTPAPAYAYRPRWQYYNAHLAQRSMLAEANRYFATSSDIQPGEWRVLALIRTYFRFKDTRLSPAARRRLRGVLQEYKERIDGPRYKKRFERWGVAGNHSITAYSTYLLLSQEFGRGPYYDMVRNKYIAWVRHQGRYGRDEVNSPHYLDRSFLPLLNLYDFIRDPTLRLWARMALDQLVTDFALLSIKNVRGGPWCRAHHRHVPFVAEISDGTQDSFYVAGYVLFGGAPTPPYLFTHQIMNYGFLITTDYRPPAVAVAIADSENRGRYEVKSHRSPVKGSLLTSEQEWDMYYYITPAYSLASLQDGVELDNHLTNGTTDPPDYVNTQVWELTFSDPMKILGPMRNLHINTGSVNNISELHNPSTALMQFRNVLFYKGHFMDYNDNLHAGGGWYEEVGIKSGKGVNGELETPKSKSFHFWKVKTPEGDVYVGITNYPYFDAGVIEVGLAADFEGFAAFRKQIMSRRAKCLGPKTLTYTDGEGNVISYDDGRAVVNGEPWPLHGYPLYASPYVKSELGSGLIRASKDGMELILDFRDPDRPRREER